MAVADEGSYASATHLPGLHGVRGRDASSRKNKTMDASAEAREGEGEGEAGEGAGKGMAEARAEVEASGGACLPSGKPLAGGLVPCSMPRYLDI